MNIDVNKFEAAVSERTETSVMAAARRRESRQWRDMSQDIALAIYHYINQNGMTQRKFAEKLGVSPAYVAKILKGSENLTLETISKIEATLGTKIVKIERPYEQTTVAHLPVVQIPLTGSTSRKYSGRSTADNFFTIQESEVNAI